MEERIKELQEALEHAEEIKVVYDHIKDAYYSHCWVYDNRNDEEGYKYYPPTEDDWNYEMYMKYKPIYEKVLKYLEKMA